MASNPSKTYCYIQCPCSDVTNAIPSSDEEATEEDDGTFDPRSARSAYSLYPLEYLLYCEDCDQIRCPRCVTEEIVAYYCPSCLFEVPGSNVRSDGPRCSRSCFECPICTAILTVTDLGSVSLQSSSEDRPKAGPYSLTCGYCQWTSTEAKIRFEKPQGIHTQLQKIRNGGQTRLTSKERRDRRVEASNVGTFARQVAVPKSGDDDFVQATEAEDQDLPDVEAQFDNLRLFYQSQLADASYSSSGLASLGGLNFGSPASLSRIMNIYTGGALADKKNKARIKPMREALTSNEGLVIADLDEDDLIAKLHEEGWDGTASIAQLDAQLPNLVEPVLHGQAKFVDELRPVPVLLRTKRSKRCATCRHIISKPESKITSNRFRIRLVAGSYVPSITVKPLHSITPETSGPLTPLKTVQYLLTFRNPIFERIKVTLATPATTPGRFASRVTLLCPQFEVDANTDVWDDALRDSASANSNAAKNSRQDEASQSGQAEAGKIWKRGRNWVSVVAEVVPASLNLAVLKAQNDLALKSGDQNGQLDTGPLKPGEDLLEIPMFVRIEWEAEAAENESGKTGLKDKESRVKKELALWCVLGLGTIAQQ